MNKAMELRPKVKKAAMAKTPAGVHCKIIGKRTQPNAEFILIQLCNVPIQQSIISSSNQKVLFLNRN